VTFSTVLSWPTVLSVEGTGVLREYYWPATFLLKNFIIYYIKLYQVYLNQEYLTTEENKLTSFSSDGN